MSIEGPERSSRADRTDLARTLGVDPDDPLLKEALTHTSYAYELGASDNRRLASLGGDVVAFGVTDLIFRNNPDMDEGEMSKLRNVMVDRPALAAGARSLGVGPHLLLGYGERQTGGADRESNLAEALRALGGVVYLQHGVKQVFPLVDRLLYQPVLAQDAREWKTELQSLASELDLGAPEYRDEEEGPDHDRRFSAWVKVGGVEYGRGEGTSKKKAEKIAARIAFFALKDAASGSD